jgi:membrane protein YqaA with SNARE-associated domain
VDLRLLRWFAELQNESLSEDISLAALLASSFLSATLLPGSSEAVLATVLLADAARLWPALAAATFGNTLGGMTSYAIGRLLPPQVQSDALAWVRRFGPPALLLSWLPIVGDALCVAAGWLRLNPWWATLFVAIGKFARYWVLARLLV